MNLFAAFIEKICFVMFVDTIIASGFTQDCIVEGTFGTKCILREQSHFLYGEEATGNI